MIKCQRSLPLQTLISIKLTKTSQGSVIGTSTVHVNINDPISKIFDLIGNANRQSRLSFNGQVLCPNLSFAFYNIHNNDTIVINSIPIPASGSLADILPNLPLKDHSSHQVFVAAPRPIPISHKRPLLPSNSFNIYKNCKISNSESAKCIYSERYNFQNQNQNQDQQPQTQSSDIPTEIENVQKFEKEGDQLLETELSTN